MKNKEITIPKGWQVKTIDEICENLDNMRVPIAKEKRSKGNIPYYGATGVLDYVSEYIFDEDLLLIGEDGADWSKFANSAYIIKGKSWVNNHAHVLKSKKINQVYLKEYLNFKDLNLYITGGTRGKLIKGILSKIPVIVPTPEEQNKIAEILSCVDEDIEKTDEIIKNMQKLKKGLMQYLLTKGIGHIRFKKTELGEIPEDWKLLELGELCDVRDGTHDSPKYISEGIPLITSKNLIDNKLDFSSAQLISEGDYKNIEKRSAVDDGDILFGMIGTIGNPVLIKKGREFAIKNVALIKFFSEDISKIYNYFLIQYLKSSLVNSQFAKGLSGSTQKFIALGMIRKMSIVVPDKLEQKKIAEILSAVDDKIDIYKQIKRRLTELKKGLMQDLLSGEVRVKI